MGTARSAREQYERGRTLRQANMYDQALEALQPVTNDPYCGGQARTQLGLCLRAMGRHEEAVTALRQALQSTSLSQGEYNHVLYYVGECLESLGRPAEAIEAYNWVRLEDPGFLDVESKIKNLCGEQPSLLTLGLIQFGRSFIGKLARS